VKNIHNKRLIVHRMPIYRRMIDSPFDGRETCKISPQTKMPFTGCRFPRSITGIDAKAGLFCYARGAKSVLTFGARIEVLFGFQRRSFSEALLTRDEPCKENECRTRQVETMNPLNQN